MECAEEDLRVSEVGELFRAGICVAQMRSAYEDNYLMRSALSEGGNGQLSTSPCEVYHYHDDVSYQKTAIKSIT